MMDHVSVVIPVLNEEQTLKPLYHQIRDVMTRIDQSYEIIFVDDGSRDGSFQVMQDLHAMADLPNTQARPTEHQVKVVQFRRNMGKAAALAAGFAHATGDVVITMDADLQDDPEEIPRLIAKLEEGFDVVSGWKSHRKDPWTKVLLSRIFNGVVCLPSGIRLHDINCGLKAYRREVTQEIGLYGELHRYIPILAHQRGFRVTEVPVSHRPREFGQSKYGLERILRGFFDMLTVVFLSHYLKRPLHFFGLLGLGSVLAGIGISGYLAVLWFVQGGIGFRPLLMLGILLVLLGAQFFSVGLLGEMLTHRFESRPSRFPLKCILGNSTSNHQHRDADLA